ncbi:hypothetical protein PaG_01777 [Moesziomyces aphidis]|uniref:Pre-mRNA-splicing factor SYF2 n=1 Tax=Moesziomyces aphidis TaxID=84754 RepID=W3VRR7_MOEAP|nr:hypothetical protein PaG_01777 [Moesziomyces aphidis]
MPPRRTRAAVKAESPEPEPEPAAPASPSEPSEPSAGPSNDASASTSKGKSKARAARHQPLVAESAPSPQPEVDEAKVSMADRQARLTALRARMAASTKANRRDILSEQSRARAVAAEMRGPSASRKLQKAEKVLEERDLRESGEDVERHRNMQYSLEDSERWDAKQEQKQKRIDQGQADFGDAAEKAYQRQLRSLKPDVAAYKQQRDADQSARKATGKAVVLGGDEIYYGDHRPSDDALDRVVSHLNKERELIQNRSRRRQDADDDQVNYINDDNKHFNKKLKRFYDKQTQEIRENRAVSDMLALLCGRMVNFKWRYD